jgi:hypothetical protein
MTLPPRGGGSERGIGSAARRCREGQPVLQVRVSELVEGTDLKDGLAPSANAEPRPSRPLR